MDVLHFSCWTLDFAVRTPRFPAKSDLINVVVLFDSTRNKNYDKIKIYCARNNHYCQV
jgi:hypothetical protein